MRQCAVWESYNPATLYALAVPVSWYECPSDATREGNTLRAACIRARACAGLQIVAMVVLARIYRALTRWGWAAKNDAGVPKHER